MANSNKFTKTVTFNGTEPCWHIYTRAQVLRLTNLPANWKKVRLGLIMSLTGATGDNVSPVAETLAASSSTHLEWLFGLSDGTGFPGDVAGGKFVGWRPRVDLPIIVVQNSGLWKIAYNSSPGDPVYPQALICNNSTVVAGSNAVANPSMNMADPTAAANYCLGLMLELDVSVTGVLTIGMGSVSNLSRADPAQLNAVKCLPVSASDHTTNSGWWNSTTPVGCSNLLVRWPLSLNHLRIHDWGAEQLA